MGKIERGRIYKNSTRIISRITKARNILGYAPEIEVEQGVERFLNFINESTEENLQW